MRLSVGSAPAFRVGGHFTVSKPPAVPALPNALALGNFNSTEDAFVDLIVADAATDTIRWGQNNGRGTFQFRQPIVVGHQPSGLGVADFNGDGEPDVAVANAGEASVSIVLAKGAGKFNLAVTTQVGGEPRGLVALGNLLVIADASGGDVILANVDASGSVATVGTVTVGRQPVAVAAGDINRDGATDVVVANRGDNTVSVLLASGPNSFNRVGNLTTAAGPSALTLGDLDLDGDLDLVVAQTDANSTSVWRGDGRGGFGLATTLTGGVGPSAVGIVDDSTLRGAGPMDQHNPDIFVANFGSNDVSLFGGRGDLSFLISNRIVAGRQPVAMVVGQFDNDAENDADVAVAGSGDGFLGVLRGQGDGSFVGAVQYLADVSPRAVTAGDFDSDTITDIVAVNQGSNDVSFLKGNNKAGLNPRGVPVNSPAGASLLKVTSGDFDADGRRDIAAVSAAGELRILRGNGDGTFAAPTVLDTGVADVESHDYNRDGRADLVATSADGNSATVWLAGSSGFNRNQVIGLAGKPRSMSFADWDGDNVLDLFVAESGSNRVEIFSGVSPFRTAGGIDVGEEPTSVAAADFDQDGRIDVAVLSAAGNHVQLFAGLAGGSFTVRTDVMVDEGAVKIVAADVNGDAFPDLLVLSQGSDTFTAFPSNGRGTFDTPVEVIVGRGPTDFVAVDLNSNRLLDIAIASAAGQAVTVLRNISVVSTGSAPEATATPTVGNGTPTPPLAPTPPPTRTRVPGGGNQNGGSGSSGSTSGCAMQGEAGTTPLLMAFLLLLLRSQRRRRA